MPRTRKKNVLPQNPAMFLPPIVTADSIRLHLAKEMATAAPAAAPAPVRYSLNFCWWLQKNYHDFVQRLLEDEPALTSQTNFIEEAHGFYIFLQQKGEV